MSDDDQKNSADEIAEDVTEDVTKDVTKDSAEDTTEETTTEETATEEGPQLHIVPVTPLDANQIRSIVEAALLAADDALTLDRLFKLFVPGELADEGGRTQVREALTELTAACEGRGFELKKVASGYRMQVRQSLSPWVSRLWEEKPPRYTRALLETMALIAYKQPATRGDIEEVRGVTVSTNIMRTLLERGWIREVGQRDVPGRPSMYGTTKEFLDYFNLSSLDQLPSLPEIRELVEPVATTEDTELNEDEANRSEATKALLEQEDGPPEVDPESESEAEIEAEAEADADADADTEVETEADAEADAEEDDGSAVVIGDDDVLVVSETADVRVQSESALDVAGDSESDASVAKAGD